VQDNHEATVGLARFNGEGLHKLGESHGVDDVWVLDLQAERESARQSGDHLDQAQKGIVAGHAELNLPGGLVWLGFFQGADELLIPALNTLGLTGKLGVECHLCPASLKNIACQCGQQRSVHANQPLKPILLLHTVHPPDDSIFLGIRDLSKHFAQERAAPATEWCLQAHELCVTFVSFTPDVFDSGDVGFARDEQGILVGQLALQILEVGVTHSLDGLQSQEAVYKVQGGSWQRTSAMKHGVCSNDGSPGDKASDQECVRHQGFYPEDRACEPFRPSLKRDCFAHFSR